MSYHRNIHSCNRLDSRWSIRFHNYIDSFLDNLNDNLLDNHRSIAPDNLWCNRFGTSYHICLYNLQCNHRHNFGHNQLNIVDHNYLRIVVYMLSYKKFGILQHNHLCNCPYIHFYMFLYKCLRIGQYNCQDNNLGLNLKKDWQIS